MKIKEVIEKISSLREEETAWALKRLDCLTKPQGSLGRLEELAVQVSGIRGRNCKSFLKKAVVVMAADHGVVKEGISAYPSDVTAQMVLNFLRGGAAINVLARHAGTDVVVVDMGVAFDFSEDSKLIHRKIAHGTKNMLSESAMTREEAEKAVEEGIGIALELSEKGYTLIGTGDMGIGNTTASSAITSVVTGSSAASVTGRGTGIDDEALGRKVSVIEEILKNRKVDASDPLDILSKIGGFEIAGLVGVILGAAASRVPVVIDGFISGGAALIASLFSPSSKAFMIASHCSVEKGHRKILFHLGLKALLEFDLRLGEGTGAVLAFHLIEAGVKILHEMATFQEAEVSEKNE